MNALFTDAEYRIFLSAMSREKEVCKQVMDEPGTVDLIQVCTEIERKVRKLQYD